MELTDLEKHLVHWLKLIGVGEGQAVSMLLVLHTQEMQLEMMDWMAEHQEASPEELLSTCFKIYHSHETEDEEPMAQEAP